MFFCSALAVIVGASERPATAVGELPVLSATSAHQRLLFELPDGSLLLLSEALPGSGSSIRYQKSSDGGDTWSEPISITDHVPGTGFAATQVSDDLFALAHVRSTTSGRTLTVTRFSVAEDTSDAGAMAPSSGGAGDPVDPVDIGPMTASDGTTLSIVQVERPGGLTPLLVVGFDRENILGFHEYVSVTTIDGATWTPAQSCAIGVTGGVLSAAGQRLMCVVRLDSGQLSASEWAGLAWGPLTGLAGPPVTATPSVAAHNGTMAVTAATDGGQVHVWISGESGSWRVTEVGPGLSPQLSRVNTAWAISARYNHNDHASVIRRYASTDDGRSWMEGPPVGGGRFQFVHDDNKDWSFAAKSGDMLFRLNADSGEVVGNRIGTLQLQHRLDSAAKRVGMSFESQAAVTVDRVRVWMTGQDSPTYRVGIQSDDGVGKPSGIWLDELRVSGILVSGAFGTATAPATTSAVDVTIPATSISGSTRYHVVVESAGDGILARHPSATSWAAVESAGGDPGARPDLGILVYEGASWSPVGSALPRFGLYAATSRVLGQPIGVSGASSAYRHNIPAQSFRLSQPVEVTSIDVHLRRSGDPLGDLELALLDDQSNEIAVDFVNPVEGWTTAEMNVGLQADRDYRLVLRGNFRVTRTTTEAWSWTVSGDETDSWGDAISTRAESPEPKGVSLWDSDLVESGHPPIHLFNHVGDEVYVGSKSRFDFINLV